jgi:FMN phosphatase YigB (HAD superfamily)
MFHVVRDAQDQIESVHREAVPGSQPVAGDDPQLQAWLQADTGARFAHLDAGLIRVVEDLVDVLVARNIIRITDLPSEAQQKLFDRKGFRDRFRRNALAWFAEPARAGDEQPSLRPGIDTL